LPTSADIRPQMVARTWGSGYSPVTAKVQTEDANGRREDPGTSRRQDRAPAS